MITRFLSHYELIEGKHKIIKMNVKCINFLKYFKKLELRAKRPYHSENVFGYRRRTSDVCRGEFLFCYIETTLIINGNFYSFRR